MHSSALNNGNPVVFLPKEVEGSQIFPGSGGGVLGRHAVERRAVREGSNLELSRTEAANVRNRILAALHRGDLRDGLGWYPKLKTNDLARVFASPLRTQQGARQAVAAAERQIQIREGVDDAPIP